VGLIITNCIVLGRLEAFASKNPPLASVADGFGAGLGYSGLLMAVAIVREVLGFGTVFKNTAWEFVVVRGWIPGVYETWWRHWTLMIMPPGAFFVLALAVWAARAMALRREARADGGEDSK
ncbi:hypothetical protein LCGC14_2376960, partial [marine sediment metagenome]